MHIINVSYNCNSPKSLFVAPDHMTEQSSQCNKTRACLVDSVVKKVETRACRTCLVDSVVKVSEGDISLQLQRYLQFVPVIGSRELAGKAAERKCWLWG